MFTTNCWPICVQAERRKVHITGSPLFLVSPGELSFKKLEELKLADQLGFVLFLITLRRTPGTVIYLGYGLLILP